MFVVCYFSFFGSEKCHIIFHFVNSLHFGEEVPYFRLNFSLQSIFIFKWYPLLNLILSSLKSADRGVLNLFYSFCLFITVHYVTNIVLVVNAVINKKFPCVIEWENQIMVISHNHHSVFIFFHNLYAVYKP